MSTALVIVGDSWVAMKEQASLLVQSDFLPPAIKKPQQALAIMMMGHELGVGPMESFAKISVIQRKPTVGAELMKAMVHKKLPGAKFDIVKSDKNECVIEAARPGGKVTLISFTWEDATAMRLTDKDNWKTMPKVMLRWRAISETCRAVFPDCLSGISYTPEELDPDLRLNEQGDVVEVKATPSAPSPEKATTAAALNQQLKATSPQVQTIEAQVVDNIPHPADMDTYDDIPSGDDPGGDWVFNFGPYKGKSLSQVGQPACALHLAQLERAAQQKGQPDVTGPAAVFKRRFRAWATGKHVSQVE